MQRPYTTCFMMTSVDGRIDCPMTEQLPGQEYQKILASYHFDATVLGRVTAELEMAEPGRFVAKSKETANQEMVSLKTNTNYRYDVVMDTNGCLLWKDNSEYARPLLIITSQKVTMEYLSYLDAKNISYIVTGKDQIDLRRSVEILAQTFKVINLGIVGGASINTAFLDAGLIDEISILIGAGIDGRASYPPLFNRQDDTLKVTPLKLKDVQGFEDSGAVWLRYLTK